MSKQPWDKWPKPWTREQCRHRYVQGDRIGQRALSAVSGVNQKTLERWCKADFWAEQRRQFQSNVSAKIDEKVAEEISDKLSVELASLALENFEVYRSTLRLAHRYFDLWNRHLDSVPSEDEQRKIVTNSLNAGQLHKLATVIDIAIKGQRIAAGLEYEDINKAIAKVKAAGYTVDEPTHDESPPASENPKAD